MKLEAIKQLLETVAEYPTVNMKQAFTKNEVEWIEASCQSVTGNLELAFVQLDQIESIEWFEEIDEAAHAIHQYLNEPALAPSNPLFKK